MIKIEPIKPAVSSYELSNEEDVFGHITKYGDNPFMFFASKTTTAFSSKMLLAIDKQLEIFNKGEI